MGSFFGRLLKSFRFFRQSGEFALTKEEAAVFQLTLQILTSKEGVNTAVYFMGIQQHCPLLNEYNMTETMKTTANKLLKQTDYE